MDQKQIFNDRGFSIIESLMSLALFTIVVAAAYYGIESVRKSSQQMSSLNTLNNRIVDIMENLRLTINQQIIYFPQSTDSSSGASTETQVAALLQTDNLPMAWSLQEEGPVGQCNNCPGRYGYVITQVPGQGGLYRVYIKFTHTEWGNLNREYQFLVTK